MPSAASAVMSRPPRCLLDVPRVSRAAEVLHRKVSCVGDGTVRRRGGGGGRWQSSRRVVGERRGEVSVDLTGKVHVPLVQHVEKGNGMHGCHYRAEPHRRSSARQTSSSRNLNSNGLPHPPHSCSSLPLYQQSSVLSFSRSTGNQEQHKAASSASRQDRAAQDTGRDTARNATMLLRAVLHASRPATPSPSHLRHGALTTSLPFASLRTRTFASKTSPPPSGKRPPPPPKPFKPSSTTGRARQTSPGTTVPKDQTWTPKDGIKFDKKPSAATPKGAGAASATAAGVGHAVSSPVEGARTTDAASTQSPLGGDNEPTQQILQMFQEGKGIADIAKFVQQLPPDQQQKLKDMTPDVPPLTTQQFQKAEEMRSAGKSWRTLQLKSSCR